jgi:hypothetical protein
VAEREENDRRPQTDARGDGGGTSQQRQRIEDIDGMENAVNDPQRMKSQVINTPKELGELR